MDSAKLRGRLTVIWKEVFKRRKMQLLLVNGED